MIRPLFDLNFTSRNPSRDSIYSLCLTLKRCESAIMMVIEHIQAGRIIIIGLIAENPVDTYSKYFIVLCQLRKYGR